MFQYLPEDSPFTPAVRLIVYVTLTNMSLLFVVLVLKIVIYRKVVSNQIKCMEIQAETLEVLVLIKNYVLLGRDQQAEAKNAASKAEASTIKAAVALQEVKETTSGIIKAVDSVPDKVVDKLKSDGSGSSVY